MIRRKSPAAAELDIRVDEAVLGVYSSKYKSSYEAAKQLGLLKNTVTRHVARGLTRT